MNEQEKKQAAEALKELIEKGLVELYKDESGELVMRLTEKGRLAAWELKHPN